MKIKGLISAILIGVAVLASLTGCASDNHEPMDLIPAGSSMIGEVQLGAIMQGIEVFSQLSSDSSFGEELDKVKQEFLDKTGIEIDNISEIYIFGSPAVSTSGNMTESGAVILTGKFANIDPAQILEKAGENYTSENDGKYTVYTQKSGDAAIVKIGNSLLVAGTASAVKDCIAVASGELDPANGKVIDTFNSLGDMMLKMVAVIPEEAKQAFDTRNSVMMPVDLQPFTDAEVVKATGGLAGNGDLQMNAEIDFSSPESAAAAVDSLKTMLSFFSLQGSGQESDLLKTVEITSSGTTVKVTHDIALADLATIIRNMQNGEGFPLTPRLFPGMDGQNDFIVPSPFGDKDN